MSYFIENSYVSINKHNEELCGDRVETAYYNETQTLVLADGMGSGVRANVPLQPDLQDHLHDDV